MYKVSAYHIPFPFIYLVLSIFLLLLIWVFIHSINLFKKKKRWQGILLIISYLSLLYSLFYIFWGFNYKVNTLDEKLSLPKVQIDTSLIISEVKDILPLLEKYRNNITKDTAALSIYYRPKNIEEIIRNSQTKILKEWRHPCTYPIRVRELKPNGTLLILSTAGIYIPFAFEGHFDGGLSHIQSGYVLAHEMAHGYGITSEADCNFVALLTCLNSENDYLQYTGLLTYWRYLMSELRDKAPYSFYYLAYHRPIGLSNDIKDIYKHLDRYPDIIPRIRDVFYDSYLKANGVSDGIDSYNKVIDLYLAYKTKMIN
jgi:hypothetical protein